MIRSARTIILGPMERQTRLTNLKPLIEEGFFKNDPRPQEIRGGEINYLPPYQVAQTQVVPPSVEARPGSVGADKNGVAVGYVIQAAAFAAPVEMTYIVPMLSYLPAGGGVR